MYLVWGGGVPGLGVSALGACMPQYLLGYHHPPCEQNDKQVQKYYLGHNFVAAGKNPCFSDLSDSRIPRIH